MNPSRFTIRYENDQGTSVLEGKLADSGDHIELHHRRFPGDSSAGSAAPR